jgi:hypothetical protein
VNRDGIRSRPAHRRRSRRSPRPNHSNVIDQGNAAKHDRGWNKAGDTIVSVANGENYIALLSDDARACLTLLNLPVRTRCAASCDARRAIRVLFVMRGEDARDVLMAFARAKPLANRLAAKRARIFCLDSLFGRVTSPLNPQKFQSSVYGLTASSSKSSRALQSHSK